MLLFLNSSSSESKIGFEVAEGEQGKSIFQEKHINKTSKNKEYSLLQLSTEASNPDQKNQKEVKSQNNL